jgi:putative ABC transport system permease protein
LSLSLLTHGWLVVGVGVLFLIVGLLAGGYPALFLSSFGPVETLKGNKRVGGNNVLTQSLVVFQFGLSIFLIIGAFGMSKQINFLLNANLGFNPRQLIAVQTFARPDYDLAQRIVDRFRSRAMTNPHIISVSGTNQAPSRGYDRRSFQYQGQSKTSFILRGDGEYLSTMGIELKEGRNFIKGSTEDRETGIIVNETFARQMGWTEPIVGRQLTDVDDEVLNGTTVIGVVKDFHILSMRDPINPVIISGSTKWRLDCILVRVAPTDMKGIVPFLQSVWKEVAPDKPFDCAFIDETFYGQFYSGDENWGKIVENSSFFAVALACLGLFGLATLSVANRTKEVGVRKVLGATVRGVVGLISRDFLKLVLISNLIAWPAAYYALSTWLNNYASRVSLGFDIFLLSGGLALVVAFATISVQIIRAALANPVEALRYE